MQVGPEPCRKGLIIKGPFNNKTFEIILVGFVLLYIMKSNLVHSLSKMM